MPPKKFLPSATSSSDEILRLAKLHYVTEQKVRAWHVWSGDIDPAALSFDRSWPQVHHQIRNIYIDRVRYILFSALDAYSYLEEDEEGHPAFFQRVYTSYYEKMDAEVIRKEVVMPASTFRELFAFHLDNVKVPTPLTSIQAPREPQQLEKTATEKNVLFTHSARQLKLDRWRTENPDAGSPSSSFRTSATSVNSNTVTLQPAPDLLAQLETATTKGVQTLKELQYLLLKDPTSWKLSGESSCYWPAEISKVKAHAEPVRTLIGVLGVPGAGKTSLINALVDEKDLLPTNCMRGSTAVVTEVAYNDHSEAKYRAEIEFLSRGEWKYELQVLVKDMNDHARGEEEIALPEQDGDGDGDGVFRGSEAAAAVEKIRAVYPMLSVEEIMDSSAEELLKREIPAAKVLGETVVIEDEDPRVFSRDLAAYIDSKGKKNRTPSKNGNASGDAKGKAPMRTIFDNSITNNHSSSPSPAAIEHWPLVRVVRIYTKAKALSTGAALVDIPVIIDPNITRARAAQEYMKKSAAYWIVSPINRAIDERVAHDLLSPNLRLQLHMDGAFDDLTFVCTKTDDVSVSEVQEALVRRDLPSPSLEGERSEKCKEIGQAVQFLNAGLAQVADEAMKIDDRVQRLLRGDGDRDSAVSDGSRGNGSPGKRKRDSTASRKQPQDEDEDEDEDSDTEKEKIYALGERRRNLFRQRRNFLTEITAKKIEKANLEAEIEDQKIKLVHDCIRARNEYTKRDLQRDFAHGVHDFCNQGLLLSTAGSGVYPRLKRNPEQDLPVFCVSTRAAQKFKGRLRKETSVYGFARLEETEVPLLQEHCIQLTKKAREAAALRFLLQLRQLLNSISLWASAGSGMRAWKQQKDEVESRIHDAIEMFRKEVKAACEASMKGMCDIITINIVRHLGNKPNFDSNDLARLLMSADDASNKAKAERPELIKRWTDIRIHTYRAICRRHGAFGNHNWNQDLASLMIKPLMNGWKNAFEVEIPLELDWFAESMKNYLQTLHIQAITSVDGMLSDMDAEILQNTWKIQYETMEREVKLINRVVSKSQREMNRLFSDNLRDQLETPYYRSATSRGDVGHIGYDIAVQDITRGLDLFDGVKYRIKMELGDFLDLIEKTLTAVAERMMEQISRDYMTCIVTPLVEQFTSRQLRFKKEVAEATYAAEMDLALEDLLDEVNFGKGDGEEEGDDYYYDGDDGGYDQETQGALDCGDVQPLKRVLESIREEEEEEIQKE